MCICCVMKSRLFWIFAIIYSSLHHIGSGSTSTTLKRPRAGDPFDTFPKNFWQEFSSPFTDTPEDEELEVTETTTHEPFPFFADPYTTINISTQLSSNVYLHCRVNDLQGKTVSWMRRKGDDLALITFGQHTYSGDSRYSLEFEEPNDWKLLIQFANERDEGPYECQVSSHPPLVLLVYLTIIVPHVEILDERGSATPEKYYKAGSTIELQCVISKIPHPSSYITWRHGVRLLNYDTSRGGISVKTDMLPGRALSRLYIANANRQDTGNYTCMLGNEITETVVVHVLNGEEPAAMQHANGTRFMSSPVTMVVFFIIFAIVKPFQR
ncbi:fibroblast growth factor receptor 3 isoform X1 [Drosophila sulfurigaster albostrigata]|uniref:Fibroblast growth factor receptor 3 n=1 Tax=Drosophila albomicans TaxID=7291 RepID=A0A6P8XYV4_DROAB|nr:fibroblast growth factor receptor 3 [Drosophila albomicans]XP_034118581.1 fibroblast growth factor receptor 3 [Drosophila albomicans]XP_062139992.1 fibroblast growth factor receptor 3 isoform X1 [Drosophila sulfurigaster albostrigata]XP_062139993.1 fibroblast growth factor receptor 3 isoform X1 [Drosophila sulfurigaster albostrigata]